MKVGLDDFFAAGGTTKGLLDQAADDLPPLPPNGEEPVVGACYYLENGCTYWRKDTREGPVPVLLANFAATIVEDVVEDDGVETRRSYKLAVAYGGPVVEVTVLADRFGLMNWPAELLGPKAIVTAGMGSKDRLREAIQTLSASKIPQRRIYRHLGWIKRGEDDLYLHAGGAIGAQGAVKDVEVRLDSPLDRYRLPDPPAAGALVTAIRESLALLVRLASDRVMFPLFALLWTTVIEPLLESLHLTGKTGVRKTELLALIQRHFGPSMTAENLPCSWSWTSNSIEAVAFYAKDSLLGVDDFCPSGTAADVQRSNRDADRVFRGRGNSSGRGRARQDGSPRPAKPPRASILSTGEDVPHGHSMRARMIVLTVEEGEVDLNLLTARQGAGEHYACAMAGFIQWFAGRRTSILDWLHSELPKLRQELLDRAPHGRTATACAKLFLGNRVFLTFAKYVGAITQEELEDLDRRARAALLLALQDQAQHQAASDPAKNFIQLVSSALTTGDAYLADRTTLGVPASESLARASGWQRNETADGSVGAGDWRTRGPLIGWLDVEQDAAYLLLGPAYRAAQKQSDNSPSRIAIGEGTLAKRLAEADLLVSHDDDRHTKKVRVGERTQGVLHFRLSLLIGDAGTEGTGPENGQVDPREADFGWGPVPDAFAPGAEVGVPRGNTTAGGTAPPRSVPDVPDVADNKASAVSNSAACPCHACAGTRFWQRAGGPWVCGACHPPQVDPAQIEWIEADSGEADRE